MQQLCWLCVFQIASHRALIIIVLHSGEPDTPLPVAIGDGLQTALLRSLCLGVSVANSGEVFVKFGLGARQGRLAGAHVWQAKRGVWGKIFGIDAGKSCQG